MQADVEASIMPWRSQPLLAAKAQLRNLDVSAFWPQGPRTLLTGQLQAGPDETVAPATNLEAQPWNLNTRFSNALPGPWDKQCLPVAELTARARDYIKAGEYLYFSPVFEYDETTGTVLAVHMGALTNDPGISGMEPLSLVAAATAAFLPPNPPRQEPSVNPLLKALLAALCLPETTPEPAAIAALTALGPLQPLQARANVATAVCTALKLPADATPEVATAACASLAQAQPGAPDPAKFVPIESVTALQGQIDPPLRHGTLRK